MIFTKLTKIITIFMWNINFPRNKEMIKDKTKT